MADPPFAANPAELRERQVHGVAVRVNAFAEARIRDQVLRGQFLSTLGYPHTDETANPANHLFVGQGATPA